MNTGEVHAIMGPNGSGKSTLARVLAGHPEYEVTGGEVLFEGKDLLDLDPEERAREGFFMAFQYPVEIPGVNNCLLPQGGRERPAEAPRRAGARCHGFHAAGERTAAAAAHGQDLLKRPVNEGFSGGEKKRNEIFQMLVLQPTLAVLDETDSGLDIDALKTVAEGVNAMRVPTAPSSSSRTISACSTTSCRTASTC